MWEPMTGIAIRLSANFHHPSGRKFSPLVSKQVFSCGVYHGSHSNKRHENKVALKTVRDGPLVRATCLASLAAFRFPQAIVVFPFWCPQQCIAAINLGTHTASSSLRISCPYLILFPPKLMSPLFSCKAPWT
jgi:hypothetical protein